MFHAVTLRALSIAAAGGLAVAVVLAVAAAGTASAQPQLQLEPVPAGAESAPLTVTPELGSPAASDAAQREAAAALWTALQKSPEQSVRDALRLENAERELRSLQETSRRNAAAVAEMRGQVERARRDRGTATLLVPGLSAVLALILAMLAWQWYRAARLARVGRWFEEQGTSPAAVSERAALQGAAVEPVLAGPPRMPALGHSAPPPAPSTPVPAAAVPSAWAPAEDYQASRGGTVRMVGVDELIDVHEKAHFFLSIGEPQQAVAVLEAHVHDQVETSALAWLDLLELYHRLGQRTEFERLRAEFRQNFTGEVPDFDHFDQPSASLEYYARALSRIVALWPAPRVLDVIEESIFRKPGLPGAEPFTLEAYRELVLLYHVARDIAGEGREHGGVHAYDTALQPLNALELIERPAPDRVPLQVPPSTPRLGLDIDLGIDDVMALEPGAGPRDVDVLLPADGKRAGS